MKEISDNYSQFVELFGKKEVDEKMMAITTYAPIDFIKGLCDFEGKDYNMKIRVVGDLFRQNRYNDAFVEIERLQADTTVDVAKFSTLLVFYMRVNSEYTDNELPFEIVVNKVKGLRYVAYNMYDRDDPLAHFYYAQGLEYLIKRALEENKEIPEDLIVIPKYGKKKYDMRSPELKMKPQRR